MGANFLNINKTRNSNDLILEKVNLECTKRFFFVFFAKVNLFFRIPFNVI